MEIFENVKINMRCVARLTLLKVALPHGCFLLFKNCTNGTKSSKTSHIKKSARKPLSRK